MCGKEELNCSTDDQIVMTKISLVIWPHSILDKRQNLDLNLCLHNLSFPLSFFHSYCVLAFLFALFLYFTFVFNWFFIDFIIFPVFCYTSCSFIKISFLWTIGVIMFPRETPIDRLTKTLKCQDAKRNTHVQDKVPEKSNGAGAKIFNEKCGDLDGGWWWDFGRCESV